MKHMRKEELVLNDEEVEVVYSLIGNMSLTDLEDVGLTTEQAELAQEIYNFIADSREKR